MRNGGCRSEEDASALLICSMSLGAVRGVLNNRPIRVVRSRRSFVSPVGFPHCLKCSECRICCSECELIACVTEWDHLGFAPWYRWVSSLGPLVRSGVHPIIMAEVENLVVSESGRCNEARETLKELIRELIRKN